MKKLFLIPFLFLISCSGSKQHQVEKAVKLYLDSSLNDPHSYESVKFSKIDTLRTTVEETPEYLQIKTQMDSIQALKELLDSRISNAYSSKALYQIKADNQRYFDQQMALINKKQAFSRSYKGKPIGWVISHTYRAKNGFGALGLHTTTFEIDSTMQKVISAEEAKN